MSEIDAIACNFALIYRTSRYRLSLYCTIHACTYMRGQWSCLFFPARIFSTGIIQHPFRRRQLGSWRATSRLRLGVCRVRTTILASGFSCLKNINVTAWK
jgi:hypothetical protein